MNYIKLGKLPIDTINCFKEEILKRKIDNQPYQWIQFDKLLHDKFLEIFENTELQVQWFEEKNRYVQKAFYSESGYGMGIHKDGIQCKSALNIAISCNPEDWVRWYDEKLINGLAIKYNYKVKNKDNSQINFGYSRDLQYVKYDTIKYTEELRTEVGDVYILDVDVFHSFKCIGPEPRIILQTKFQGFPTLNTISKSLKQKSFKNLIPIT